MVFILIFALGLAGTGIIFGQNPYSPDAPPLLENNNPELNTLDSPLATKTIEKPKPPDSKLLYFTRGLHFTPRLGIEDTYYSQQGAPYFTQTAIRANIDVNWYLPVSRFEADLRFNFTALPLISSDNTNTVRFFGANANLGYALVKTSFLKLRLLGGIYYTSSNVTNQSFGYSPLIMPELYPSLTFYLFNKLTIDFTYRYMYLGDLFASTQVQIVRSAGLSFFTSKDSSISLLLEDNGFNLILPPNILIQYYSLGVALGFSF